jgi:hypothetical protein
MKKNIKGRSTAVKFPFIKNVEYISIFRDKNSVLEIDGKDVEGFSWRELQLHLGKSLSSGLCQYTMKFVDDDSIYNGRIRAVSMNKKSGNEMDEKTLSSELKSLKDQLARAEKSGGVSFEMLLSSTKQGHEAQIGYLNEKIKDKDDKIQELKRDISELENDLDDCVKESSKTSSISQYLAIGEKILNLKLGTGSKVSLKESNTSDIPEQILIVLGVIDWQKVDAASTQKIADNIQQYLSLIPKEYFKG